MNWTPDDVKEVLATIQTIVITIAGLALTLWGKRAANREHLDRIRRATKGAYNLVAAAAPVTKTTVDDKLAEIVGAVESEIGKRLRPKEIEVIEKSVAAMNADPNKAYLTVEAQAKGLAAKVLEKYSSK